MAQATTKDLTTLPVGRLGLIPLISCKDLGEKVNEWLIQWRKERSHEELDSFAFEGYQRDSYLIPVQTARFGSGEAKCTIMESVRGDDIYLMVDVCNYSLTYSIGPYENLMSPDDHFQDLKRVIGAIGGKARRVNVIMPYLYESRQNIRSGRESLDCATALQELVSMGVENIITFDAHDARVQNATPLHGFETVQPSYQFIKALLNHEKGLHIDNDHFMIISPDEGSMNRAIYLANILGVDMGMYYKRLDYSKRINGRHPIAAYEFLGPNLKGKDMILIDDMISSGDTIIKIASLLKEKGAGRVYICSTFGFFTDGLDKFDDAYKKGYFDKLLTTNLVYQSPELLEKPYYISCDMSKYIAYIIDTLNHDSSISDLLNPYDRIKNYVKKYTNKKKDVDYFDGISFAPTLLGQEGQKKHDFLYWEFDETDQIGVRMGDWKMVVKKGTPFLYNLATDIHEDHDIAAGHPDIVKQMKEIIRTQHTPNPHFSVTLPSFE